MKRTTIIALSVIRLSLSVQAQNYRHITVEDAVNITVENNSNIKMSNLDRSIANANYHQTDAIFLPQITVGYTALTTNNPLNAFGFLLQQESVTAMDFDPAKLNNPGATQNYGTQVEAKLPLLNMDMIYARKGARAQEEAYKYKAERTKEYIEFEVRKAYIGLQMAYQARNILRKSLDDVKQIHLLYPHTKNRGHLIIVRQPLLFKIYLSDVVIPLIPKLLISTLVLLLYVVL